MPEVYASEKYLPRCHRKDREGSNQGIYNAWLQVLRQDRRLRPQWWKGADYRSQFLFRNGPRFFLLRAGRRGGTPSFDDYIRAYRDIPEDTRKKERTPVGSVFSPMIFGVSLLRADGQWGHRERKPTVKIFVSMKGKPFTILLNNVTFTADYKIFLFMER